MRGWGTILCAVMVLAAAGAGHPARGEDGHALRQPQLPVPLAPRAAPEPLPLAPPSQASPSSRPWRPAAEASAVQPWIPAATTLGVLLTLVAWLAWLGRRGAAGALRHVPREVAEVLGRVPLSARLSLHVLRFGPKLVLVSFTPHGSDRLAEIDDPDEVARLIALCRQQDPRSITGTFRQVMEQITRQHDRGGAG